MFGESVDGLCCVGENRGVGKTHTSSAWRRPLIIVVVVVPYLRSVARFGKKVAPSSVGEPHFAARNGICTQNFILALFPGGG